MYFFSCLAVILIASCRVQANVAKSEICEHRNGYIPVDGSCDSYIECREYNATSSKCPDGLHFDIATHWPMYPCGYPHEVPCPDRTIEQKAKPTGDCPHQYGFFPSPTAHPNDCGEYLMCIEGQPKEMRCPPGLGFDPSKGQCDWPDNIPTCNVKDFLGFACPAPEKDEYGFYIVTNHKLEGNCNSFYTCVEGNARLLSCDAGLAFDAELGRCVDADQANCTPAI